jgi:hyperosmotically inducible periplasmic protein
MKRLAVVVLTMVLVGSALGFQNSNSKKTKKTTGSAPAVDCSTATDASITAAVKEKLSNTASVKDANLDVSTNGGVVTLTGKLKTGALKGVATSQTKRVPCVKRVDNKCEVEDKTAPASRSKNSGSKSTKNKNSM